MSVRTLPAAVRTRRARLLLLMALALALLGAGLGSQYLTVSPARAVTSPCETGENVGEVCQYVNVVSAGPKYNIDGYLLAPNGVTKDYEWKERNTKDTTWWWRYTQFEERAQQDTMHISINLTGGKNIGLTASWPMTESRCYYISTDDKITQRDCPVE